MKSPEQVLAMLPTDADIREIGPHTPTEGMVYGIRDGDWIKIGFTTKTAEARRRALQTGNPRALAVEFELYGTDQMERRIHRMLAPLRTCGEWFFLPVRDAEFVVLAAAGFSTSPCPTLFYAILDSRDPETVRVKATTE